MITSSIVLWLLNINLGVAFGAGLYESRIVVPQWFDAGPGGRWNAKAARDADVGLRFWAYVTTIPLTLLTLASVVAVWWAAEPVRFWWVIACAVVLVERVMTFGYFIPTMIRLMREGALPEPGATLKARQWVTLGSVRQALTFAAWQAALAALSRL